MFDSLHPLIFIVALGVFYVIPFTCLATKIFNKKMRKLDRVYERFENLTNPDGVEFNFPYTDEHGTELYSVIYLAGRSNHYECKTYHKGKIDWLPGATDIKKVLYNLPRVCKSDVILLVHNEQSADALTRIGLPSSTPFLGFHKMHWREQYTESLRNKIVVFVPENCVSQLSKVQKIIDKHDGNDFTAVLVRLPDLRPYESVEKWLNRSESKDDLLLAINEALAERGYAIDGLGNIISELEDG